MKKGFSLIELLVASAIIITTTTVVLGIILTSFRISSKNTSSAVVRQNGNYAMSQISRILQFSESFDGVSDNSAGPYKIVCDNTGENHPYIKVTYIAGAQKIIACEGSTIKINNDSIIDYPKIRAVSSTCRFTCTQENSGVSPIIGINFDLALGDVDTAVEKRATINFSTSIKMRNN